MPLSAREIVLSPSASAALHSLETSSMKSARSIARRVRELSAVLRVDCLHGEVVRKQQIPRFFADHYGASNLFIEDLPAFWRMIYSVAHQGTERYVAVLEIVDHAAYDRWFPGKGRGR
jgi:hypothetical protein